jgi:hypothetical protein
MLSAARPFALASLLLALPAELIVGVAPAADDEAMGGGMMEDGAAESPGRLTQQEINFFETKIRPVLVTHCYGCHAADAKRVRGNLLLDTHEGMLKGGDFGPAIVPGEPDDSLLIRAIRFNDADLEMPPKGKLPDDVIRDFETWVRMGAPDPRAQERGTIDAAGPALNSYAIDIEKGRTFWAFQAPTRTETPTVRDAEWPLGDLDRFTLASMEARGARPTEDADRRVWLRRVTFDLTGLPPTPQELVAFEKDTAPGAHERVVDHLLASTAFGERWGRHWLDVARYGESSGKESNVLYPHAWRYRDYVIDAFNADKPFDQFIREQLAGDLIPAEDATDRAENLIATGYLAIGPKSHSAQNPRQFAMDVADEQIDAFSQGMLGLTIACARCHDHKFDPIPQRDYYAVAGIFLSSRTAFGTERAPGNRHAGPIVELPTEAKVTDGPTMPTVRRGLIATAKERIESELAEASEGAGARDAQAMFRVRQQRDTVKLLDTILERFDERGRPTDVNRVAMGMVEGDRTVDAPLLVRGEIDKPEERVPRGFPQVLSSAATPAIEAGSGRLELATWVASQENPLTARVWANRVWLHLFGRAIVATPDNFGASGLPPTDQRLLDHLATRFVGLGWSTKSLVREIVLSRTYRLASTERPESASADPDNTTFWRYPSRRLDAEAIRDAMLAAAGTLDRSRPVGSIVNFAEGAMRDRMQQLLGPLDEPSTVRSVYLPIVRDLVPESLDVFDFAEPAFVTGDRAETNVPTQALYLMNAPEVLSAADAFAARLLADGQSGKLKGKGSERAADSERIMMAFQLALGRKPSAAEIGAAREFLSDFAKTHAEESASKRSQESAATNRGARRNRTAPNERSSGPDADTLAWSAFCQTLFQSAEFRTLE